MAALAARTGPASRLSSSTTDRRTRDRCRPPVNATGLRYLRQERAGKRLAEPGARVFDLTGRPMKGWLLVDPAGCAEDKDLRRWVERGIGYARSLPPK
jgi:hypothetical protein